MSPVVSDRLTLHERQIGSGVTRFACALASYVATARCTYGVSTPLTVRKYARNAVPAPSQRGPCPALALLMSIPGPFVHTRGHCGMARLAATIARPFLALQPCAARGQVVGKMKLRA